MKMGDVRQEGVRKFTEKREEGNKVERNNRALKLGEERKKELELVKLEAIRREEDINNQEKAKGNAIVIDSNSEAWVGKIKSYLSQPEDLLWASRGLVARVRNGMCVPVLQKIVVDAGFRDFKVLPMGGIEFLFQGVTNA